VCQGPCGDGQALLATIFVLVLLPRDAGAAADGGFLAEGAWLLLSTLEQFTSLICIVLLLALHAAFEAPESLQIRPAPEVGRCSCCSCSSAS